MRKSVVLLGVAAVVAILMATLILSGIFKLDGGFPQVLQVSDVSGELAGVRGSTWNLTSSLVIENVREITLTNVTLTFRVGNHTIEPWNVRSSAEIVRVTKTFILLRALEPRGKEEPYRSYSVSFYYNATPLPNRGWMTSKGTNATMTMTCDQGLSESWMVSLSYFEPKPKPTRVLP